MENNELKILGLNIIKGNEFGFYNYTNNKITKENNDTYVLIVEDCKGEKFNLNINIEYKDMPSFGDYIPYISIEKYNNESIKYKPKEELIKEYEFFNCLTNNKICVLDKKMCELSIKDILSTIVDGEYDAICGEFKLMLSLFGYKDIISEHTYDLEIKGWC